MRDAEEAKAAIPVETEKAKLAWYRKCALVVEDERERGDAHGAQARAARRLKIPPQYLGRMLAALEASNRTG